MSTANHNNNDSLEIVQASSPERLHIERNTVRLRYDFRTLSRAARTPGTLLYRRIHSSTPVLAATELTRHLKVVDRRVYYLEHESDEQRVFRVAESTGRRDKVQAEGSGDGERDR